MTPSLKNHLFRTVKRMTAEEFGFTVADLEGRDRSGGPSKPSVVVARHAAMTIARSVTTASYPEIARVFHRDNHASAMHAERATKLRMQNSVALALRLRNLEARILAAP